MRALKRTLAAAASAVALTGLAAAPGFSAGSPPMNVSFFTGGAGTAGWLSNQSGIVLSVPDPSSYAGFTVHHAPDALPGSEPSFTTDTYQSGSPRWLIELSSGSYLFGYPDHTWNVEACAGVPGGAPLTYDAAAAALDASGCSGDVTAVAVVADASQPVPATDTITDVTYDGITLTR